MKSVSSSISLFLLFLVTLPLFSQDNNIPLSPVNLGDPFILLYNGKYYAYGTNASDGIQVYISDDLNLWSKSPDLALHKNDSWGEKWFWAPEVYYIKEKGKFYMYYSANEHICVATSDSPLGPFKQEEKKPMLEGKAIDNSLFIDDDGKAYLSFVRFTDGNEIWIAELESDLQTIKKETMKPSLHVSQPWEDVWPRVNEGSFIIKHNGIYYLSYSANSFESPYYGVGYATATSPLGPWVKYENNPILQNPEDLVGVGHSAMFVDKDGQLKIVFHAHRDKNHIHPRGMYIANVEFSNDAIPVIKIGGEIIRPKLR